MWTIAGSIAVISFLVSPVGQRIIKPVLTNGQEVSIISEETVRIDGSDRLEIY